MPAEVIVISLVPIDDLPSIGHGIDPRLNLLLRDPARQDCEIAILLRLKDGAKGTPEQVRSITRAGNIVSGRMFVRDAPSVRSHPDVASLKASVAAVPALHRSRPDTGLARPPAPAHPTLDGHGVVVGFIDYGFDIWHPRLRRGSGASARSPVIALWDQNDDAERPGRAPSGYGYGIEHDQDGIGAAVRQPSREQAYDALHYRPDEHYFHIGKPRDGAHGTGVADVAIGDRGIAPGAEVILVQLRRPRWEGVGDFGNSARLLEAADYIFRKAESLRGDAPVVINVSLATQGGPHDGSTLLEQGFDALLAARENRAIVVAAGNSGADAVHATRTLRVGRDEETQRWRVVRRPRSWNELEIWYPGSARLAVRLTSPTGEQTGWAKLGESMQIVADGNAVGHVFHREDDPNNHDNHVDIVLDPVADGQPPWLRTDGDWRVTVKADPPLTGAQRVTYDVWLEREVENLDSRPSTLLQRDRKRTLGSIACGARTVTVGAHALSVGNPVCGFSSRGPVRDSPYSAARDRSKPDLTAPGYQLLVARSGSDGSKLDSGTSYAAPHVTGVIALMFQAARAAGRSLSADEIRDILRATAAPRHRLSEPTHGGAGRLAALAAINRATGD